jgi:outer membrane protein assembly factor BamB
MNSDPTSSESPWAAAARKVAAIAGCFSLVLAVWLLVETERARPWNPLLAPKIQKLKAELARNPKDEALKKQIRELDAVSIGKYRAYEAFAHRARILLVGGCLVALVAAEVVRRQRLKSSRRRPPPRDTLASEVHLATEARRAVVMMGIVFAGGAFVLGFPSRRDVILDYARSTGQMGQSSGALEEIASRDEVAKNWPMFRGPGGVGVASDDRFPERWDGEKGVNILWKTPLPLPGHNSPIVWGNRIFLAGATEKEREVYCFAADTGQLVWRQLVMTRPNAPATTVMEDTGFAPSTMATDGHRVYAIFPTGDLVAFDLDGKPVWSMSLGPIENTYGHASSLCTDRNRLIVQVDQGSGDANEKSVVMAIDGRSGRVLWQTKRNAPNSWSTPIVIETDRRRELITCSNPWVIAYNPDNGAELWRASCLEGEIAPSPGSACGIVYVAAAGSKLSAIRPGGEGDVTKTQVVWAADQGLPDIVSPLSNGRFVFLAASDNTVTCYDAATGRKAWDHAFSELFKSSPVLVGNRVYFTDFKGVTHLFDAAVAFKEIATSPLGEEVNATPAFVGGRIYIRGKDHLYCIGVR